MKRSGIEQSGGGIGKGLQAGTRTWDTTCQCAAQKAIASNVI